MSMVYFIKPVGMDGPVKIGFSHAPWERVKTLSTWSPFELELIGHVHGTFEDEQYLHKCCIDLHSHREWFNSSDELYQAIRQILASGSVNAVRGWLSPKGSIKKKARKPIPPEARRYLSYGRKVMWAERKLRRIGERTNWCTPDDVKDIICNWKVRVHGCLKYPEPAAHEMQRLEEYLSDPKTHSVFPSWLKKSQRSTPSKAKRIEATQ